MSTSKSKVSVKWSLLKWILESQHRPWLRRVCRYRILESRLLQEQRPRHLNEPRAFLEY